MRTGKLYYCEVDLTDNYEAQLAHNVTTGEYTMDVKSPTEKYSVKGKMFGNLLVLRGDKLVDEDIYYGEWNYQEKLGQSEITLIKLELDDQEEE